MEIVSEEQVERFLMNSYAPCVSTLGILKKIMQEDLYGQEDNGVRHVEVSPRNNYGEE